MELYVLIALIILFAIVKCKNYDKLTKKDI
jgi:hypothetical protein